MSSTAANGSSRAILGRGMIYTIGTAAPILANALVTPAVTRAVGSVEFGRVSLLIQLIQVTMLVCSLGLAAAITRHGLIEASGVPGASALTLRASGIAAVLCLMGAFGSPALDLVVGVDDPWLVALGCVAAAGFACMANAQAFLRVVDRPLPFVMLALVATLGGPVIGLGLVLLHQASAVDFVSGLAAGYVLAGAVGLALTLRGARPRPLPGDLARALRIGVPTVPHAVGLYLSTAVLVFVVAHTFGTADAGRMQLAILLGSAPSVLTTALNNAWAPLVYAAPRGERASLIEGTGRDIALITAAASGFVAAVAPLVLVVLADARFDPAPMTPAVAWMALGGLISVVYLGSVHLVFAEGRSTGLAIVTPLSVAVGTAAAVALSRTGDVPLTAAGMTVTYTALAIGAWLLARRVSPERWRPTTMGPAVAIGSALCLAGALAPIDGPEGWLTRTVLAIGCVALACGRFVRVMRG
ncbi:lipopolysaccharide biosynthesis protein [Arsenicicoccus bolidensis]|uniref:lipopolysaccharide biosynthesis protein n=1 Tax=Arsenicicoccus bolidensis TaxID=229480 RepID=UPI0004923949|nr:oligosaccharide flippase family protein [Arsenicicoccus bolidensis]